MASGFSEDSGVSESKSGLRDDSECSYCGIVLYKNTDFFKESEGINGEILYECTRCYILNEDEKSHMLELSLKSKTIKEKGEEEFVKDHASMLAMSDFDSSLNGAVDFEGWMAAAAEVMKAESTGAAKAEPAKAGCGEVKTLNILPDVMMAEKIKQMQDESIAEMEKAKSEWADKSDYFISPSDMEFIHGDGVHGPDALSYQDWRNDYVRIPQQIDVASKWLSPKHVATSASASGGSAAMSPEEPPTVTTSSSRAAGGAGASNDVFSESTMKTDKSLNASSSDFEVQMSARQMWLLGLMDN
jgi:hypothetical protein